MKLNAFIHTETYSVQSIGPCLLELERETGYARGLLVDATVRQRQKVSFAAGESSAKASNGVIRGELDVYDLGASGGQQMVLSITSEEDNAVFTVVSPNGDILAKEAKNETLVLPDTGDYHVIVGGTRGNASYDLTIGIQGTADPVSKKGSGLEASGLIEHATAVHRKEVSFAAGKSSATVSNGVVRGHQDVYDLRASGGQKMNLSITSTEDNAVFHLVSPSGDILAQEARNETIVLPDTGDYHVIVGGTRGNASYDLTIGIQ
ncbi:hypothetical protein [Leptothoe sp. PORK10 BA2]|uniref:hypothetical protein n=1 Tax=Leptothoe sp. PORK10 BA2 TaxID=3110254 RepID=UPI002B1F86A5|nr:hypothetical protein [Leptothoe sp. PORK10 BA2]MEA5464938.1 hypothetical protein [Leptothoe sp. PORK10 BA2]